MYINKEKKEAEKMKFCCNKPKIDTLPTLPKKGERKKKRRSVLIGCICSCLLAILLMVFHQSVRNRSFDL